MKHLLWLFCSMFLLACGAAPVPTPPSPLEAIAPPQAEVPAPTPRQVAAPSDDKEAREAAEHEAFAKSVESDMATLSPLDRTLVEKILPALARADATELGELKVAMESDTWQFEDQNQQVLWHQIVHVASSYAYYDVCMARSFWFILYVKSWGDLYAQMADRYNRAQYYLALRHGQGSNYACN